MDPLRRTHLTGMLPGIPQQPGYNKRLRAAGTLISAAITALAKDTPSWHDVLRLVDSTPLPCGKSREPSNAVSTRGAPCRPSTWTQHWPPAWNSQRI